MIHRGSTIRRYSIRFPRSPGLWTFWKQAQAPPQPPLDEGAGGGDTDSLMAGEESPSMWSTVLKFFGFNS